MPDFFKPPKVEFAEGYRIIVEMVRPSMDEATELATRFFVEHGKDRLDPNRFSRPFGIKFLWVSVLTATEVHGGEPVSWPYYRYTFKLLHESRPEPF